MYEINFNIYGLRIKFSTAEKRIANYIKEDLGYFLSDHSFPDIGKISFSHYPFTKKKIIFANWFNNSEQLAAAGTHLYLKNGELIICNFNNLNGLGVRLSFNQELPYVEGVFCSGRKEFFKKLFLAKDIYTPQLLSSIKRLVIHYPLLFLLEQKKGIYFLHASAVEKEGKGFVFTGLPGCGKTTVMTTLLRAGFRFLSDNFLLWNKERFFTFPESFRIRDRNVDEKENIFISSSLKGFYKVNPAFIASAATPIMIFLLRIGGQNYLKKIATPQALGAILDMEQVMKEFRDYSYLKLCQLNNDEQTPLISNRIKCLGDLLEKQEVFILSLKKGQKNNKEFLLKVLGG